MISRTYRARVDVSPIGMVGAVGELIVDGNWVTFKGERTYNLESGLPVTAEEHMRTYVRGGLQTEFVMFAGEDGRKECRKHLSFHDDEGGEWDFILITYPTRELGHIDNS